MNYTISEITRKNFLGLLANCTTLICRQVFGYVEDFDEKMKPFFIRYFKPITYNALPAVLLLSVVAFQ